MSVAIAERLRSSSVRKSRCHQTSRLLCRFGSSLAQRYSPSRVIGVDIDSALIDQCQYTVEYAFSLQKATNNDGSSSLSPSAPEHDSGELTRKRRKVKNGAAQDIPTASSAQLVDYHYFPAFFPELYGTIDVRGGDISRPVAEVEMHSGNKRAQRTEESQNVGVRQLAFPRNLVFYSADWTNTSIETDQAGYDVILGYIFNIRG